MTCLHVYMRAQEAVHCGAGIYDMYICTIHGIRVDIFMKSCIIGMQGGGAAGMAGAQAVQESRPGRCPRQGSSRKGGRPHGTVPSFSCRGPHLNSETSALICLLMLHMSGLPEGTALVSRLLFVQCKMEQMTASSVVTAQQLFAWRDAIKFEACWHILHSSALS